MATSNTSRRRFLKSVPVAVSSLGVCQAALLNPGQADAQASTAAAAPVFQLFTDEQLQEAMGALAAAPGNKSLVASKRLPFAVVLTVEKSNSPKEFEWHEERDHIVQILEGTTVYEVGGTPVTPHSPRAGEWLAPSSAGSQSFTLKKGDMLVLPRGTPHRRTTATSVTFLLISPSGTVAA